MTSLRRRLAVLGAGWACVLLAVGVVLDRIGVVRHPVGFVVVLVGAVGLAAVGAASVAAAVLRPVRAMAEEATRLSVSDPDGRLPAPDAPELAVLAGSLNALLAQARAALARERAFVDDASHELRTPLTVLRGELELAALELADGDLAATTDGLARARAEAERLGRLAEDLLVLARLDGGAIRLRRNAVELVELVRTAVARFPPPPLVDVRGPVVLVGGDEDRLLQVLTNLLANAVAHAQVQVLVSVRDLGADGAEIEVADDGPGFPATVLAGAFERFRRGSEGRRRGEGSGLGLAIVEGVVRAHGGTVAAGNGGPLGGAVVTVRLPLAEIG
jgi:signal transduction histidine kinase